MAVADFLLAGLADFLFQVDEIHGLPLNGNYDPEPIAEEDRLSIHGSLGLTLSRDFLNGFQIQHSNPHCPGSRFNVQGGEETLNSEP
jgi:hypothetical protein